MIDEELEKLGKAFKVEMRKQHSSIGVMEQKITEINSASEFGLSPEDLKEFFDFSFHHGEAAEEDNGERYDHGYDGDGSFRVRIDKESPTIKLTPVYTQSGDINSVADIASGEVNMQAVSGEKILGRSISNMLEEPTVRQVFKYENHKGEVIDVRVPDMPEDRSIISMFMDPEKTRAMVTDSEQAVYFIELPKEISINSNIERIRKVASEL